MIGSLLVATMLSLVSSEAQTGSGPVDAAVAVTRQAQQQQAQGQGQDQEREKEKRQDQERRGKARGKERRVEPTPEQKARLNKLVERDKAWIARTTKELAADIQRERVQLQRKRQQELEARNAKTRTELAPHLREADTPAARAEARRVDIGLEAAELLRRSAKASAAEKEKIDRRAAELMAEWRQLSK